MGRAPSCLVMSWSAVIADVEVHSSGVRDELTVGACWEQVNKEEAGAAAKPVDEDVEDTRGYDWRNKD